jgi:hypothetical protein
MKIELDPNELRKYSIFVGVPMYGGKCEGHFAKSLIGLATICATHAIKMTPFFLHNESLVQRARNYVVDEFLRSNHTHLMFIDADIAFNPTDVLTLLSLQTSNTEKYQIMTGPYSKKTIAWEKVKSAVEKGYGKNPFDLSHFTGDYVFNPLKEIKEFRIDETVEVSEAGTGFMMIPKSVFEKYAKEYPQYSYKPDHLRSEEFDGSREIIAYFDCGIDPVSKRYLSEDYFFCKNARDIGISIHMCPWMQLHHIGTYIYRGSMAALAALGASPTADSKSNPKTYNKKTLTDKKKPFKMKNHRP